MIPRILHQIWIGPPPPRDVEQMMDGVRDLHPHWEYRLWTDANLPELRNQGLFEAAQTYAMKADVARYEILLKYGGVYLDADFECHRAIDPLFPEDADLRLVSEFGVVCNGVFGCSAQHPFLRIAVERLNASGLTLSTHDPHLATGPYFIDSLFVEEGFSVTDPATLLPGDYFFPPRTRVQRSLEVASRKRYLTHKGLATWRRRDLRAAVRRSKLRTRLRRFADLTAE